MYNNLQRNQAIIHSLERGVSIRATAELLGLTKGVVSGVWDRHRRGRTSRDPRPRPVVGGRARPGPDYTTLRARLESGTVPGPVAAVARRVVAGEITVTDLCARAGVNPETFRRWVRGDSSPRLQDIEAVMQVVKLRLRVERYYESG